MVNTSSLWTRTGVFLCLKESECMLALDLNRCMRLKRESPLEFGHHSNLGPGQTIISISKGMLSRTIPFANFNLTAKGRLCVSRHLVLSRVSIFLMAILERTKDIAAGSLIVDE